MFLAQFASAAALVVLWQWFADSGRIDLGFIGSPLQVFHRLVELASDGSLLHHVMATTAVMLSGFAIATVVGTAVGVLMGLSRVMSEIFAPFLAFLNGMPRLVLQPLILIVLGFGFAAKVSLVVIVIFVMIVVNTAAGFSDIDEGIVTNARVLGASKLDLAIHVYLPALALMLISSARTTLGFALQAALVAEFIGTAEGLGYLIVKGQQTFDVAGIWAALVLVVILAILLDQLLSFVEQRALHWKAQVN